MNKAFRLVGLWTIMTCGSVCVAQAQIRISGKVIDAETKESLAFATIRLLGFPVGTVSNTDGAFEIFVSPEHRSDTINISYMGYKSYSNLVSGIGDKMGLVMELALDPITLDELVLSADEIDAREVLKEALARLETNLSVSPYSYQGFMRELKVQGGKTVSLTESAFDVYDNGYKKSRKFRWKIRENINLKEVRTSKDYINKLGKLEHSDFNALASSLRWNMIKTHDEGFLLRVENSTCKIEEVVNYDGNTVYAISLSSMWGAGKQRFEHKENFHIDVETYAIYKYDYDQHPQSEDVRHIKSWILPGTLYSYNQKRVVTVYEFEKFDGKMYLKYFRERAFSDIIDTQLSSVTNELESDMILVVSDIQTGKFKKAIENKMDQRKSLILQATSYNTDFWRKKEELNLVLLTKKQLSDLEWEMPLEEQFEFTGKSKKK